MDPTDDDPSHERHDGFHQHDRCHGCRRLIFGCYPHVCTSTERTTP